MRFLMRTPERKRKTKVGLFILILVLAVSSLRQNTIRQLPVDDFVAYWAAARLQIQGQNPYSAGQLLETERAVGMQGDEPLIMLNPPWTLAFLLPFGFVDYFTGRLAWLILELFVVFISVRWMWLVYKGSLPVDLILTFCFIPLLVCLVLGQITPLILLGVAGFLYFERHLKPLSAGACLVPLTLKPQLFYLFWLALLLWTLHRRQWRVLLGATICGAATFAAGAFWNGDVVSQYIKLASSQPPLLHWRTPTLGTVLRTLFGMEHSWLQVTPMFAGAFWFLLHWKRRMGDWIWSEQMPLILVVSLTTTGYVWFYDQMLFLPAILQVSAAFAHGTKEQRRSVIVAFSLMNLILLTLVYLKLPPLYFVWSFGGWVMFYWYFFVREQRLLLPHTVSQITE